MKSLLVKCIHALSEFFLLHQAPAVLMVLRLEKMQRSSTLAELRLERLDQLLAKKKKNSQTKSFSAKKLKYL
jgi:hypothetical protein